MKKYHYFLTLMAIVCFAVFAVNASAKDVNLTMKYSHGNNEFDATQLVGEIFKKLIEDRSGGKLKVDIYPGTLTTSGKESMEFLIAGTVDLGPVPLGHIAGFQKDVQFFALPYLFNSYAHYTATKNCGALQEIVRELEKATKVISAGFVTDTNGLAFATKKPVFSMTDCKGIKLRSMTNPLFVDMYSAFGFNVTPTDWSEVYTSLQTGVVEGDDLGVKANYDYKFNEVVKAFAITKHSWTQQVILVSPKLKKKVSETQWEMILEAIKDAIAVTDEYQFVREDEYIEKAKKDGYTVTYPDIKPFKEASKTVYEKWFAKYPRWKKWYDEIQYLDPGVIKTKAESRM